MKTTSWLSIAAAICTVAAANAQNRPGRQGPPPEIVQEFDADGDGQLSQEERKAAHEARIARMQARRAAVLEKFDADGDGELNEEERANAHKARRAETLE
ncbi:MAG: EF-hand domain-containing protein, partial [Luteolibacter sp.]